MSGSTKGVAKPEPAGEPVTIDLNGGFDQWRQVKKTYYDHAGDTYHRDSQVISPPGRM